jgi:hypothetical protein
LSASITPCFSSPADHILSLELSNNRTDRPDHLDIKLEKLAIVSRHYTISPLRDQKGSTHEDTLGWQERASYHFTLASKNRADSLLTECPIGQSPIRASSLTSLEYLSLERAHACFEEQLSLHQMAISRAAAQGDGDNQPRSIASIRRANTVEIPAASDRDSESDVHATSIARLCPTSGTADTVHLLCYWSAQSGEICGVRHVRSFPVRPFQRSNPTCPVTVTATHPSLVSNDFESGPVAVPIEITLQNRLLGASVDFDFAVDQPDTFDFNGPENVRIELKGGEKVTIPMQVLFHTPGIFDVQKVRLTMDDDDAPSKSFVFPTQWMVSVRST